MYEHRPRNFTLGVFKFRLRPTRPIPTDGDLLRTITRGVRGTAMPTWHELPDKDRLSVIQYIKYELAVDRSPIPNEAVRLLRRGAGRSSRSTSARRPSRRRRSSRAARRSGQQAKCWECHGQGGKGDGEKAAGLKDDFGFPIRPADLTTGQFKSGPVVEGHLPHHDRPA